VLGVLRDIPDLRDKDLYIAGGCGGWRVTASSHRRQFSSSIILPRRQSPLPIGLPSVCTLNSIQPLSYHCPGESYGGVYVPMLADRILRHNSHVRTAAAAAAGERGGSVDGREHGRLVNLVGYTVGNGVTDDEVDGNSQVSGGVGHRVSLEGVRRHWWH
jgi:hypothetical protein